MKIHKKGFTMVEVLVAILLSVTLYASLLMAYNTIKSLNMLVRHRSQAVQVVRGQMDMLKVAVFSNIANSSSAVSYDAGPDGTFGNADDLQGTLTTTVQDFLDMDGDTNTSETAIDVDGNGSNDATAAKPVRVSFTWTQRIIGQTKAFSVFADTLIAA